MSTSLPTTTRSCQPCTACCDFGAVPILEKAAYELCKHASDAGCEIYVEKPKPCADYACLWIEGEFDAGDRPDQIGLAFDIPSLITGHPDYAGIPTICARELWPDARADARAGTLLMTLSRKMVVRLTARGGRTELMGPGHLVRTLSERAAARQSKPASESES